MKSEGVSLGKNVIKDSHLFSNFNSIEKDASLSRDNLNFWKDILSIS